MIIDSIKTYLPVLKLWRGIKNAKKVLSLLFILATLLPACKKYKENKSIHLKKPESRILGSYHITEYSVNGADSMPLLNLKFKQNISEVEWEFSQKVGGYGIYKIPHNYKYPEILYEFRNKKKELFINYFVYSPAVPAFYNIFTKNFTTWRILKLYTKNKQPTLRLKGEFNGKTYIIQFN